MKIIFAQGNPGAQYTQTRHNIGFIILDLLAEQQGSEFIKKPKFHADIAELTVNGEKVLLVKPTTFYNESGQAARMIVDFYKVDPVQNVLVIHDDLALPFGTIRIRDKGRDAGNNGIKSLNTHLGISYYRIRVGIYNDLRDRIPDTDFVLGNFKKSEMETVHKTLAPKTIELIQSFCEGNLATTSHKI